MSADEVKAFLKELLVKETHEFYLIAKFMIYFSVRIGTAGAIKVENLDFYCLPNNSRICLPDTKNKKSIFKDADDEFMDELIKFIEEEELDINDYLFYSKGKDLGLKRRGQDLSLMMNKLISDSKVLIKSANYTYTSHMLRKTQPNLIFQEKVEEARSDARKMLGHKQNSTATNHYLD